MSATAMPTSGQQRYKYGGGPLLIAIGVIFVLIIFQMHDEMTSGKTEWHLWSTKLPAIPKEVMVGFWWFSLLFFGACTLIALLPKVSVIVDSREISAQSPITRNFKTIAFSDIRDIEIGNRTFSIHSRKGTKITINQGMMRKRDYNDVLATVQSRAGQTS